VSFRITTLANGDVATIRVEGRLGAEAIPELRGELELAVGAVRLDLSGLKSADADGVRELLELSAKGVKLCEASAYIRQLLEEAS
jgi:ABC-type transporter Mla MlaB component